MGKRKRSKNNRNTDLSTRSRGAQQLDIRRLFLRDAPRRTGYRPVPGVSIYPQNFREPRIIEIIDNRNLKRHCCNDPDRETCRCGDVVACPNSQEFQSRDSSENGDSGIEKGDSSDQNIKAPDPIDFRGLRGMLWSKISPEKFEMFERRFSEPNATGSRPVGLTDNFETPIFFANTQPASSKLCEMHDPEEQITTKVNDEDFNSFMEMWQSCMGQVDCLEQEIRIGIELQFSIENELERGVRLLKPRLRQLTISERKLVHICINRLSSQVGFPKLDKFSSYQGEDSDPAEEDEVVHLANNSWFMGMEAMDIVNEHHKIADLQGKLVHSHMNIQDSQNSSSYLGEFGFEDEEVLSSHCRDAENRMIHENSELSLQCRTELSKYLNTKLQVRESSLRFKRNLLLRLSNFLKLLESSPLSNFPFTSNSRHMFLNPVGIGRRSISWTAFDFVDLVTCVLKLYRLDFPANNETHAPSMFSSNVSISSNTHKLKAVVQDSFSRIRRIKNAYNFRINKIREKEVPPEISSFLKHNCDLRTPWNFKTLKNRQMSLGISDLVFCSGIFEWHTPLSLNSTIVEIYPFLECYDVFSYVLLNGVMGESTSLMYIRSLLRLVLLFSSFQIEDAQEVRDLIIPIKASRVYIRKEEVCLLIGPLDVIDLSLEQDVLQDEVYFQKKYPKNLIRCNSFIKAQESDLLTNYLPPAIKEVVSSDESLTLAKTELLRSRLKGLGNSQNYFEKIHIYMIGVLLYFCLTGSYYDHELYSEILNLKVSHHTKELLNIMLNPDLAKIPSTEKILDLAALHPEKLIGTVGIQANFNLFQSQISDLKLDI
ncbi:Protein kinase-like domain containing protein [Cryptosporidium felis]|nr:Protein kinase-like domain containing protein [Cryptosporidium felis]